MSWSSNERGFWPRTSLAIALLLSGFGLIGASVEPISQLVWDIRKGEWAEAEKVLERLEKPGACPASICAAARALIEAGNKEPEKAIADALRLAAGPAAAAPRSDWLLNEVGVLLYRSANGDRSRLGAAVALLRQAQAAHGDPSVNVRFNLARALEALGETEEARRIDAECDAEGMLIDPGFTLLGDFAGPDAIKKVVPGQG